MLVMFPLSASLMVSGEKAKAVKKLSSLRSYLDMPCHSTAPIRVKALTFSSYCPPNNVLFLIWHAACVIVANSIGSDAISAISVVLD